MQVSITNPTAFHCANVTRSAADFQAVFRYIVLEPEGGIAAADGFRLAHHPHGVEPFDGQPVFMFPLGKVPTAATNLVLDTESKLLTWDVPKARGRVEPRVCTCEVSNNGTFTFPDYKRVIPTEQQPITTPKFGFNVRYAADYDKVLKLSGQLTWKLYGDGKPMILDYEEDSELLILLMPLRQK